MNINKIYFTWDDICAQVDNIISCIRADGWQPSVVVGLTRGGLLPATLLSHRMGIPMCSLDISFRDNLEPWCGTTHTWIPDEIGNGHRILVMDDINDSGRTFDWIRQDWSNSVQFLKPVGDDWPWNHIKFAALVHNAASTAPTDYHAQLIDKSQDPCWIVFPWESR